MLNNYPYSPPDIRIERSVEKPRWLKDIYQLNHDTMVDSGYIQPRNDGLYISHPHLDWYTETEVLVAHRDNKLLATVSLTPAYVTDCVAESYFPEATTEARSLFPDDLVSPWRVAADTSERRSPLALHVMHYAMMFAMEAGYRQSLNVIAERHLHFYQRYYKSQVLAHSKLNLVQGKKINLYLVHFDIERALTRFEQLLSRHSWLSMPYKPTKSATKEVSHHV